MGQILTRAHDELFRRTEDESFATMQELWQHCYDSRQNTEVLWHRPQDMAAIPWEGRLELAVTPADTRRLSEVTALTGRSPPRRICAPVPSTSSVTAWP